MTDTRTLQMPIMWDETAQTYFSYLPDRIVDMRTLRVPDNLDGPFEIRPRPVLRAFSHMGATPPPPPRRSDAQWRSIISRGYAG